MTRQNFSIDDLNQYLEETEQTLTLAQNLAGIEDGTGEPCPFCGGEDRFRFFPENRRFYCRHCMSEGKGYDIYELITHHHGISREEAERMVAIESGFLDCEPLSERTTPTSSTVDSKKTMTLQTFDLKEESDAFKEVHKHRPEIDFATYQRAGAVGFLDKRGAGIAIPMFDNDGNMSGYVLYYTDGSKRIATGSKSGIVGIDARDALLSKRPARKVLKCAGVSDYLVLPKLFVEAGLESDYYAFTNGAGEMENPGKFDSILRPALEGQTVVVLQDNDEAGEKGARKWAKHLVGYAVNVRIVQPPQEWNGKPIKDFRDFAATLDNANDVFDWIEKGFENADPIKPDTIITRNQSELTKQKSSRMVRSFDEISTEPPKWFMFNKIPADDITIISGDGAVGKTYFVCHLAEHVTHGKEWADGSPCEMGSVLFFPPEGNEGAFKRRLEANGVDLLKCRIQTGGTFIDKKTGESYIDPIFLTDSEGIEKGIDETEQETGQKCRLLVVDPVMSFTAGKNPYKDHEVREILDPIPQSLRLGRQACNVIPLSCITGLRNRRDIRY